MRENPTVIPTESVSRLELSLPVSEIVEPTIFPKSLLISVLEPWLGVETSEVNTGNWAEGLSLRFAAWVLELLLPIFEIVEPTTSPTLLLITVLEPCVKLGVETPEVDTGNWAGDFPPRYDTAWILVLPKFLRVEPTTFPTLFLTSVPEPWLRVETPEVIGKWAGAVSLCWTQGTKVDPGNSGLGEVFLDLKNYRYPLGYSR